MEYVHPDFKKALLGNGERRIAGYGTINAALKKDILNVAEILQGFEVGADIRLAFRSCLPLCCVHECVPDGERMPRIGRGGLLQDE